MELNPHLSVSDAAGFIEFCKQAFGAQEPFPPSREPAGKRIMHAELRFGNTRLMLADEFPEYAGACKSAKSLGGVASVLNLTVDNADEVWAKALAAGAKVSMPLADQFWGDRYGQLTDPFGNVWAVSQPKERLTPEQIQERMKSASHG